MLGSRYVYFFVMLCIYLVALISGCRQQSESQAALYPVTRVIDGDTIAIDYDGKEEKVRLIGVNTPEIHGSSKVAELYGRKAAAYTEKLLQGREVRLEFDVQKRDKYNRLLAYVYLPDGTFVNARLVADGYAQVMTVPPNVRHAEEFVVLQSQARKANRGLWGAVSEDKK